MGHRRRKILNFFAHGVFPGRDTDGYGVFTIDPLTGIMKTRLALDHAERSVYRIAVAATDNGIPPKQTVRVLRVEVLDVNDNRPTFSSSSLIFKVLYPGFINLAIFMVPRTMMRAQRDRLGLVAAIVSSVCHTCTCTCSRTVLTFPKFINIMYLIPAIFAHADSRRCTSRLRYR